MALGPVNAISVQLAQRASCKAGFLCTMLCCQSLVFVCIIFLHYSVLFVLFVYYTVETSLRATKNLKIEGSTTKEIKTRLLSERE